MSVKIIQDRLAQYAVQSEQDEINALKEIFQEIALAALSRADFFKYAAFQGGTCLRILHGLQRFSEDLDFVLKENQNDFDWKIFLKNMTEEFSSFGIDVEVQDRSKMDRVVQSAFLKEKSIGQIMTFPRSSSVGLIKIKIEIDTNPPPGSHYEVKYLDFPFAFGITTQDLPSLFAGKSHALLCREYIKGRDWYDFLWYVSRKIIPNFELLTHALNQMGPWQNKNLTVDAKWYVKTLRERIKAIDWKAAKQDVARFLKPQEQKSLEVWGEEFFLDRMEKFEGLIKI